MKYLYPGVAALALMTMAAMPASAGPSLDATLAAPGFYNGSGNPGTDFTVDTTGGVETGLRARFRGGPNVVPVGDAYSFATGGSGALGLWNYDFSVNLSGTGLHISDVLANTTLTIIDFLHGVTTTVNPFTKWADNSSYEGSPGTPVVHQNGLGNALTATLLGEQNSENLGFGDSPLAGVYNNADNDVYRYTLTVRNNAGAVPVGTAMDVITGSGTAVPEPMSMTLLGVGALGSIAASRRRRNKAA